jgi:hypothetical protein
VTPQHRIVDLRFSEHWCECTCGEVVRSVDQYAMSEDWKAHRKAMGAEVRAISDAARSNSWIEGIAPARRPWVMKSEAIRKAEQG